MPTNISDATYFELRLIEEACRIRQIPFKYAADLKRYTQLVHVSHGAIANSRIAIQESRLENGLDTFINEIDEQENIRKSRLIDFLWIGRKNIGDRVADVDLLFANKNIGPISLKSGGEGTERNLGGKKIKNLIGYDSQITIAEMKKDTIKSLKALHPKIDFGNSWSSIKKAIKDHPDEINMRAAANLNGKKYQLIIADQLIHSWESSSEIQKMNLLAYLALQNDIRDKGLRIFVACDDKAYLKNPLNISHYSANILNLTKNTKSVLGTLDFSIDTTPHWRLNINFTNGLGLSPLAIRVFNY